jgi:hypothetical protein
MVIVSKGMFDTAVRWYARYAMPKTPRGEEWTYYGEKDRRIGATDGVKCWLEDDVVREMSTSDGQKEG